MFLEDELEKVAKNMNIKLRKPIPFPEIVRKTQAWSILLLHQYKTSIDWSVWDW